MVSAKLHTFGNINFEDYKQIYKKYTFVSAYATSKLANILFAIELND